MKTQAPDLQDILATLDSLKARVEDLSHRETAGPDNDSGTAPPPAVSAATGNGPAADDVRGAVSMDYRLLRKGIRTLNSLHQPREFPEFFGRLARQTGLRLLLLKRWTSGLQVYLEVNITLPAEARRKRSDGRAPIPLHKDDVFVATAQENAVYAGPVPAKNFPLDLTLMLGRGARDRRIIILPLPSQGHWNTFLYLDGGDAPPEALQTAEILAHYALARMILAEKGVHQRQGRVDAILKTELARRGGEAEASEKEVQPAGEQPVAEPLSGRKRPAPSPESEPGPDHSFRVSGSAPEPGPILEDVDPFAMTPAEAEGSPGQRKKSGGNREETLTPEAILHHSGELPALPKAACHIMAVIEDPRTTATRLEKALAMDQALTAKVLRIANSPFYGAVREIKTVSESIVRLGFVAIRNWTLVTAARSVFLSPGAGVLYRKIWQQSVLSAMSGQLVAQAAGMPDPEAVFIGGLMQNIGQLVLARSHPELFQEILLESTSTGQPYHVIERRLLGFDHGELGALLIREWNLSRDLEEAVRWHHRFDDPRAHNNRLAAMVALGEEIAWCSGAGGEEEKTAAGAREPSPAAAFLGFSPEKVAELERQAAGLSIDPHFFN